jgi:hypothetical protein
VVIRRLVASGRGTDRPDLHGPRLPELNSAATHDGRYARPDGCRTLWYRHCDRGSVRAEPSASAADGARCPSASGWLQRRLAANGRPVPAEELLEQVWDEAADPFTTTVKTTISRLRAKLGDPPVIQTVRESGYLIGEA